MVVATNTPVNDRFTIHTKQAAYRSYVIAARVPAGTVTPGLYWDTEDPYHYVRLQPEDTVHDLLIVGGEDHHTGEADDSAGAVRAPRGVGAGALPRGSAPSCIAGRGRSSPRSTVSDSSAAIPATPATSTSLPVTPGAA